MPALWERDEHAKRRGDSHSSFSCEKGRVERSEGPGAHNSCCGSRGGANYSGLLSAAEFSGGWVGRCHCLDGILSRLVPSLDGRPVDCWLRSAIPRTQSMQKKKQRERRLVLDVSRARCRDCLLSPSHRQLVGGLRLSGVG